MKRKLKIHRVDSIDSTHTHMKSAYPNYDPNEVHVLFAREQTGGVGQWKRLWKSPKGGLYATFYFRAKKNAPFEELTEMLAQGGIELIAPWVEAELKCPNDIVVHGEKLGGVLCHVIDNQEVILSIGLNVNTPKEELKDVGQPATSLRAITGKEFDLEKLQNDLANRVKIMLEEWFDRE